MGYRGEKKKKLIRIFLIKGLTSSLLFFASFFRIIHSTYLILSFSDKEETMKVIPNQYMVNNAINVFLNPVYCVVRWRLHNIKFYKRILTHRYNKYNEKCYNNTSENRHNFILISSLLTRIALLLLNSRIANGEFHASLLIIIACEMWTRSRASL